MTSIASEREPSPLRHVRSTVIVSGLAVLRDKGLFDAYAAALDGKSRDVILGAIAGTWLPVDVAMSHFAAVDGLGMRADESFEVGATSGRRFQATLWGTLARMAIAAAVDLWTVLGAYHRVWGRVFDGGGFLVTRVGPKEATVELRSIPLCRYAYFRDAYRGASHAGLCLFARTVYVREVPRTAHPGGFTMRIAWV